MDRGITKKRQRECQKVRRDGAQKGKLKNKKEKPTGREAKGQRRGHIAQGEAV